MRVAGLVTWLLAAVVGAYLLGTWLSHGGLRDRAESRRSRFAPGLIFGHGGLAAAGLGVWIAFLVLGTRALGWATFAVAAVAATLGLTMFGLWLRAGHGQPRGRHAFRPRHAAEDNFPPPAVLSHGLFAVATLVLVLLSALRVG